MGAYWGRAGVAAALTPHGQDLPYQRGGFGDHLTGHVARRRARRRAVRPPAQRRAVSSCRRRSCAPGCTRSAPTSTRACGPGWPTARGVGPIGAQPAAHRLPVRRRGVDLVARPRRRPALAERRRRAGAGRPARRPAVRDDGGPPRPRRRGHRHAAGAVRQSSSRAEWGQRLDAAGVWWAKVQHAHELIDDEQAHAAGGFVDVPRRATARPRAMVATPVDFSGRSRFAERATPELGQDTELVLLELGLGLGAHRGAQAGRRHHLTPPRPPEAGSGSTPVAPDPGRARPRFALDPVAPESVPTRACCPRARPGPGRALRTGSSAALCASARRCASPHRSADRLCGDTDDRPHAAGCGLLADAWGAAPGPDDRRARRAGATRWGVAQTPRPCCCGRSPGRRRRDRRPRPGRGDLGGATGAVRTGPPRVAPVMRLLGRALVAAAFATVAATGSWAVPAPPVHAADGQVPAGGVLRVAVPEAFGGKTVVGQLAVDRAHGAGFVTAFACADGVPDRSGRRGHPRRPQLRRPGHAGVVEPADRPGRRRRRRVPVHVGGRPR